MATRKAATKRRKSSRKTAKRRSAKKARHPVDSVRFSEQLKWLKPYLKRANDRMPGLDLPRHVRPFKPPKRKIMRTLGNVYFETKTISLATHDQLLQKQDDNTFVVYRIVKLSKKRVLETFAHELSHFLYPHHNYEQDEYTKTIFKAFEFKETCPTCQGTGKVHALWED